MTTQAVKTLQHRTQSIRTAALVFEEVATASLLEKFSPSATPPVEEPEMPDWEVLHRFLTAKLEQERARMAEAARRHDLELMSEPRRREERDEVVQAAYDGLVRVRHVLEQAMGKSAAYDLLGIRGRTPERPQTLLHQMRSSLAGLRDPRKRPAALQLPGMRLDWDELIDALAEDARNLEIVLTRERHGGRRADLALQRKNEVQASVQDTYVGFAKILEGLYVAAGRRDLAARLRPTVRKARSPVRKPLRLEEDSNPLLEAVDPSVPISVHLTEGIRQENAILSEDHKVSFATERQAVHDRRSSGQDEDRVSRLGKTRRVAFDEGAVTPAFQPKVGPGQNEEVLQVLGGGTPEHVVDSHAVESGQRLKGETGDGAGDGSEEHIAGIP